MKSKFSKKILNEAKRASNSTIINTLLREYYDETLEQAQCNPKSFGENKSLAEEDPKTLAKQYTKDYRQALMQRDRESLENLYANHLNDHSHGDGYLNV